MTTPIPSQQQIYLEAAEWLVRLDDIDRQASGKEQQEWIAWLQRSARHVQAYFDIAELSQDVDDVGPDQRNRIRQLLQAATIAPASAPTTLRRPVFSAWSMRAVWAGAAAAAVCAIALLGTVLIDDERYVTGIGEQAIHRLADGSSMVLNTRSRAQVRFDQHQRVIELDGEAMFTVAKDADRPFLVHTRTATARAIGTTFNVYAHPDGATRVSVVQGIVQVYSGAETATDLPPSDRTGDETTIPAPALHPTTLLLLAGEEADVRHNEVAKRPGVNIAASIAWRQKTLVFHDAPLDEVAAQFNRYNSTQFIIDPAVGRQRRLSGTFDPLHPEYFYAFLIKDESLAVYRQGDITHVEPR